MSFFARLLLYCSIYSLLVLSTAPGAAAQATTPVPTTAVQIENTNASYTPTDVNIPQANPARPTVTNPAHIPPTGYLQFEQGFLRAGRSPGGLRSQNSISQTTKIAVTTRLMFQFISQPYAFSTVSNPGAPPSNSTDPGDLLLGAQWVVHESVDVVPTVAVGYIRRVRSGTSANLDAGGYSQSAFVFFDGNLPAGFQYEANLLFNEQNNDPVRRLQFGQTLTVSHTLFPVATHQSLTGVVELYHFTQPFPDTTVAVPVKRANAWDILFSAAYAIRPNLVFDAAITRGLTSTSTTWQGTVGVSYLLPHRLWPDRHPVVIPVGRHS